MPGFELYPSQYRSFNPQVFQQMEEARKLSSYEQNSKFSPYKAAPYLSNFNKAIASFAGFYKYLL